MIGKASVRGAALLAVAAVVLAGCGDSGSDDSGGGQSGALEGRGPIKFATGKDTSGNMQKLVDEWNGKHPDEKVTITELPESADDQRDAMVRNAQAKSKEFTILNMDVVWTAEFAANRWVEELPQDQFDLDNFLEPAVNTAKYRDKLYAVPVYSDGGLLFYRKDLLDAAGVTEAPKTWDEMKTACDKVKALPGNAALGCYAGQFDKYEGLTCNFSEAVQSAGGSILDESGKPTVDTQEAKDGLNFLVDGVKSGQIPQAAVTYQEEPSRRAFQDGELIFLRNWPYVYAKAGATDGSSKINGKFEVAPLPGKSGPGVSTLGGHNFGISAFAENKATALDFIKFFTSEEAEKSNLLATSQAPTRANLYDDKELVEKFPYLTTLKESILTAVPRPQAVKYGDVTAAMQEAAYSAINGQASTDDALKDLQSKLESLTTQ
ncbi:ABC transporter substrate-binding protein [Actinophytocola oryzae]|uniref:Multiple sugar transport system substrate-binding protein n=1 Tax=Actinophytocola oryzae TaxID=502181 RepID=A0A4V3FTN1_9PSEU|nr:ABC transporter substrate-binding protein [Actinophytocola oryzae]TDV51991.1 multiple sugar transport system substrate-binding protein [Actinophytocola oryzae]